MLKKLALTLFGVVFAVALIAPPKATGTGTSITVGITSGAGKAMAGDSDN